MSCFTDFLISCVILNEMKIFNYSVFYLGFFPFTLSRAGLLCSLDLLLSEKKEWHYNMVAK
jgi:hypothetical protein